MRSLWDRVKGLPIPTPAPAAVATASEPAVPSGAEMTDTEILDWIEKYVQQYFPLTDEVHVKFSLTLNRREDRNKQISGEYRAKTLRQAIQEINQKVVLK